MKRWSLPLLVTVALLAWSPLALADVTLTGTVTELGAMKDEGGIYRIRFKLDNKQTDNCLTQGQGNGYAWFWACNNSNCLSWQFDNQFREWYSMLLLGKKGATVSVTVTDSTNNCHVTSCSLL